MTAADWTTLGSAPTTDAAAIRRAYAKRLREIDRHDPTAFQALTQAYRAALQAAQDAASAGASAPDDVPPDEGQAGDPPPSAPQPPTFASPPAAVHPPAWAPVTDPAPTWASAAAPGTTWKPGDSLTEAVALAETPLVDWATQFDQFIAAGRYFSDVTGWHTLLHRLRQADLDTQLTGVTRLLAWLTAGGNGGLIAPAAQAAIADTLERLDATALPAAREWHQQVVGVPPMAYVPALTLPADEQAEWYRTRLRLYGLLNAPDATAQDALPAVCEQLLAGPLIDADTAILLAGATLMLAPRLPVDALAVIEAQLAKVASTDPARQLIEAYVAVMTGTQLTASMPRPTTASGMPVPAAMYAFISMVFAPTTKAAEKLWRQLPRWLVPDDLRRWVIRHVYELPRPKSRRRKVVLRWIVLLVLIRGASMLWPDSGDTSAPTPSRVTESSVARVHVPQVEFHDDFFGPAAQVGRIETLDADPHAGSQVILWAYWASHRTVSGVAFKPELFTGTALAQMQTGPPSQLKQLTDGQWTSLWFHWSATDKQFGAYEWWTSPTTGQWFVVRLQPQSATVAAELYGPGWTPLAATDERRLREQAIPSDP
ncbi:hypothetical protein [Lacticaseibacillus absianus]|uniref:hypothetical protein n=1 Tax=Lacticaseibacillus absianus TaxID=2729623 RepID=UPI0015C98E42|nr:hypothetical protein [Lacticaseibacillus absianus]